MPNEQIMSEDKVHYAKTEITDQRYRVSFNGEPVLESIQAVKLDEHYDGKDLAAVIYFPESLITALETTESERITHCPIKGDAAYLNFREVANSIWYYPEPLPQVALIRNHFAFDQSKGFQVSLVE